MATRVHNNVRTSGIALGVALTIHSAAAIAVLHVEHHWRRAFEPPVEIDVRELSLPPLEYPVETVPPAQPAPDSVKPRLVVRRVAARDISRIGPSHPPPPPNQQSPPNAAAMAPPVFGVTLNSVVSGDAAITVPVGNTTMTQSSPSRVPSTQPRPYANSGAKPFVPVPKIYIATLPRVLVEINNVDIYPAQARALGIEGVVRLSVDIDEKGTVVNVRVLRPAGHEFDQAAVRALRGFRFSPALTGDGRAVPYRMSFDYKFTIGD